MKTIAFHTEQLGLRGSEIALYDYAYYAREYLDIDPIILFRSDHDNIVPEVFEKFEKEFDMTSYMDFHSEVTGKVDRLGIDAIYYIKSGQYDGKLVRNAKNLVHAVFQFHQPHGDKHAYVSKWLATKMGGVGYPYVPHIVDILKYDHDMNYRESFGIKDGDIVFGYFGGRDSFNIPFAKQAVIDVAREYPNRHFIFLNVDPFVDDLDNVKFFTGTSDMEFKVAFINTCDVCLHARNGGESFGLTVGEFSAKNKPVLTTSWCTAPLSDEAHLDMLGDAAIVYYDYYSLYHHLTTISKELVAGRDWNMYKEYTPRNVINQFKQVFLD